MKNKNCLDYMDCLSERRAPMIGTIVRFVVSALVLMLIGYLLPGIIVSGLWRLDCSCGNCFARVCHRAILGDKISPRSRGLFGLSHLPWLFMLPFIVPNYLSVSLLGSLLAAFVIRIIDAFVPAEIR